MARTHLADLQLVLRMIDALLVHDVADMDHAFDILGHLHERAELLELRHRPFDDRADRVVLLHVVPRIAQRLLEPERNALIGRIHRQHDHFHRLARFQHVGGLAHLLRPRHLRQMNQTVEPRFEFDKGAEIGDARYRALDPIAGVILIRRADPGVRLQLFQTQRDALLRGIDLENLHVELLADRESVGRLIHAPVRNIGDMQHAVHPADIDESPVIEQAAHRAMHHHARRCRPLSFSSLAFARSSSRTTRRSTTMSSFSVSSLMMRQAISWPTSVCISGTSRAPLREAGMKARIPTSTERPPLITAVTMTGDGELFVERLLQARPVLRADRL